MVLTNKEKYLIKTLHLEKGWGAKKIVQFVPSCQFKVSTVSYWINRIKQTGDVNPTTGRGRPRTIRSYENINTVANLIQTPPGTPKKKHLSPREIERRTGLPRTSVRRIIKEDLKMNMYKRIRGQELTERQKAVRLERCRRLRARIRNNNISQVIFTDEKIFTVRTPLNTQNSRVYSPQKKKKDVPPRSLVAENPHFTQSVMVSVGISKQGKTDVHFIEPNTKVNSEYYTNVLLGEKLLPDIRRFMYGRHYIFQQDGATSHTSAVSTEYLARNVPDFLHPEEWPPYSPDLNPVDYFIWGALQEKVYQVDIEDLDHLKRRIRYCWRHFSQRSIVRAINTFLPRLEKTIEMQGGHIEPFL